ncbi:hypothetical protein FHX45_000628 [Amycolatopsis granulosa]|nr:hypothetical protein [Amycolatopsis granulosa]
MEGHRLRRSRRGDVLTMRRTAVVAGAFTVAVLGLATPAVAGGGWGSTTCSQTPTPACELGAGTNGTPGKAPGAGAPNSGRPGGGTKPGNGKPTNPGDTITGGDADMASCSYVKSDYQPPSGGAFPVAHKPRPSSGGVVPVALPRPAPAQAGQGPGAWYVWKCSGEGSADTLYRPPVWIPDGEQPGAAQLPSPEELAQMARRQLRLPSPTKWILARPACRSPAPPTRSFSCHVLMPTTSRTFHDDYPPWPDGARTPVLLLVGPGYSEAEVARELGVPPLGRVPHDPRGAAVLCGRPATSRWGPSRSALGRFAEKVAGELASRGHLATPEPPPLHTPVPALHVVPGVPPAAVSPNGVRPAPSAGGQAL